jgi:pyruvate dehydrogenase E2 component (dihydrolipoamide acetyltransferase)
MAEIIKMPKMSDTMEEGVIATWLKKVGDTVKVGDILAEIETDKATMELESYEAGTLLHIGVGEKESVAINSVIAIIGEPGENIAALLEKLNQPSEVTKLETSTDLPSTPSTGSTGSWQHVAKQQPKAMSNPSETAPIFASPLAKRIAKDQGYDLSQIQGTGEGGRIIQRDLVNLTANQASDRNLPATDLQEPYEDKVVSQMRKQIAKRLSESKLTVPEFYLTIAINMDQLIAARPKINEYASTKITFNDLIIKAVAMALKKHPEINAAWLGDRIRYYHNVHIGVAMAIDEGLLVPVIRSADQQSLTDIATQVKTLNQKAQLKQLKPADCEGHTFTISNLGMLGIDSFTAIINQPAACILAVGAIQQLPIVKQNAILPAHIMQVTLTCDHRVVDGAIGAVFLNTFKTLLEEPLRLLV